MDDALLKALKDLAHRTGRSFKATVEDVLRAGLAGNARRRPRTFRQKTAALGGAVPGVVLRKSLALADAMEDAEIVRGLERRR